MQGLIDNMDGQTQQQLHEARNQALNQATQSPGRGWFWSLAGTAAVGVLVVLLINSTSNNPELNSQPAAAVIWEDLDLLANDSDPEFYQDLEFLDWLDQNDVLGGDI